MTLVMKKVGHKILFLCFYYESLKSIMVIQNQLILQKMHITYDTRKNIPCCYYKHQIYVRLCIFVFFVMQNTQHTDKELNAMKDFY